MADSRLVGDTAEAEMNRLSLITISACNVHPCGGIT
jgi:hypothetical protein